MKVIEVHCLYCNRTFRQPFPMQGHVSVQQAAPVMPDWSVIKLDDIMQNLADAEQRIEELENKLASLTDWSRGVLTENVRLQEAARWIPVEERLPQSWDDVLVSDGKTVCLGYWNFHEWDAIFGRLPFEVAYWRPLPEPPKGR